MKRPLPVTVFGILFLLAGAFVVIHHSLERPLEHDYPLILAVGLSLIAGGVFFLLGHNWSRWVLLVLVGFFVVVSWHHSLQQFAVHFALLLLYAYAAFAPSNSAFFRKPQ